MIKFEPGLFGFTEKATIFITTDTGVVTDKAKIFKYDEIEWDDEVEHYITPNDEIICAIFTKGYINNYVHLINIVLDENFGADCFEYLDEEYAIGCAESALRNNKFIPVGVAEWLPEDFDNNLEIEEDEDDPSLFDFIQEIKLGGKTYIMSIIEKDKVKD